jgi:hypothetical protein
VKIVGIGGLHLNRRIRLVIVIDMLRELGDLAILTFLMMYPLSKNSILKQYGPPRGTTTPAMSGRRKKNSGIVSLRNSPLFCDTSGRSEKACGTNFESGERG